MKVTFLFHDLEIYFKGDFGIEIITNKSNLAGQNISLFIALKKQSKYLLAVMVLIGCEQCGRTDPLKYIKKWPSYTKNCSISS